MAFTSETLTETQRLLQAGRKEDADKHLRKTVGLSSRESKELIRLVEKELAERSQKTTGAYTSTPMDGPLKSGVASLVLGKGKKIDAINYIKSHRKITLPECMTMIEEVEREFADQYRNRPQAPKPFLGFERILLIPLLLGMAFSAFSGYLFFSQWQLIKNGDRLSGTVIDFHYQAKGGAAAIIEYDWKGEKLTYQSAIHLRNPVYEIDEAVTLYVNRADPDDVLIDTFTDRWSVPGILGLIGSVAIIVTCIVAWFNVRQ